MTDTITHEMQYQLHGDRRWVLGPGGPDEASAVETARQYWRNLDVTGVRVVRHTTSVLHQNTRQRKDSGATTPAQQ